MRFPTERTFKLISLSEICEEAKGLTENANIIKNTFERDLLKFISWIESK